MHRTAQTFASSPAYVMIPLIDDFLSGVRLFLIPVTLAVQPPAPYTLFPTPCSSYSCRAATGTCPYADGTATTTTKNATFLTVSASGVFRV